MSQHDYIISNQGFPATRADINNVLNSIATLNSGTSAPATQYAGQMWLDTTTATNWILYIYDGADNIQIATINTSTNTVNFTDSALDVLTDTTPQLGGNLDVNGNSIVSTSNGNITLAPDGTGDVVLSADTVKIGDVNANATITTDGTGDLILNTNSGTNSGSITIADGANGAITVAPNGTGIVTVTGNLSVDGGTIKLDGNYPVGTSNVALGDGALDDPSLTGCQNTAVGSSALTALTTACCNTAVGDLALSSTTTGNSNTAVGTTALQCNTTGLNNTAVGRSALLKNTTGCNNTALGIVASLCNTTGICNTAIGHSANRLNETGSCNVAVGYEALCLNTASSNVAVGHQALLVNTTGYQNTAIGAGALDANTTGLFNTTVGYNSLTANTTGDQGTALGLNSLVAHTTGVGNTAIGIESANSITTGAFNVMVGRYTGDSLTTGSYNTHIGNDTDVSGATVEFTVAIGHGAVDKGTNTGYIAPTSGVYQGNNSASWSTTSDERIKKNITDNNIGLEKINKIQVRNFEYKTKDEITELPKNSAVNKQGVQVGVIAQEIEKILPDVVKQETTGVKSVNPDNITWYLVNAIKELTKKVEALESK